MGSIQMWKKWSIGKIHFFHLCLLHFRFKHIMINHEMSFWFMFLPIVLYKNLKVLLVGPLANLQASNLDTRKSVEKMLGLLALKTFSPQLWAHQFGAWDHGVSTPLNNVTGWCSSISWKVLVSWKWGFLRPHFGGRDLCLQNWGYTCFPTWWIGKVRYSCTRWYGSNDKVEEACKWYVLLKGWLI